MSDERDKRRKAWWAAECKKGPEGKPCRQRITQCTRGEGGMFSKVGGTLIDAAATAGGTAILPGVGTVAGPMVSEMVKGQIPGVRPGQASGGCQKYQRMPGAEDRKRSWWSWAKWPVYLVGGGLVVYLGYRVVR